MIAKKYTPENFYNGCLNRKIAENDISIPNKANIKLSVLPYILNNHLSASMIGNFNTLTPKLETDVLAGGTRACMGFREAKEQDGKFIPNTLLNDDIRHYISPKLQVIAVFRKEKDAEKYNELTYKSNKVEWNKIKIPKEYKYLESLIFGDEQGDDSRGDSSRDDGPDDGGSGGAGGAMGTPTVSDDTSSPSSSEKEPESESSTKPDTEDKLSPIGEINIGGPTNEEIGKMSIEILKSESKPSLIDEYIHKDDDIEL